MRFNFETTNHVSQTLHPKSAGTQRAVYTSVTSRNIDDTEHNILWPNPLKINGRPLHNGLDVVTHEIRVMQYYYLQHLSFLTKKRTTTMHYEDDFDNADEDDDDDYNDDGNDDDDDEDDFDDDIRRRQR